jgi:SAM-dependent methyltransferase
MAEQARETNTQWDKVYSQNFMTMWYPNEDIIRFTARLIRKRLTYDEYQVKKAVTSVLDLGCGNGRHAIYFAREGLQAAGVDVSEQAIAWAKDWARREGLEIDFRVGDISKLPFPDDSFGAAVSHGVLDHVRTHLAAAAVQEVRRVLTKGGLFYCDLRCVDDFEFGKGKQVARNTFVVDEGYERGLVQHFFTFEEIESLFDGQFRIIYSEITERRLEPDFQRRYSRWVLATEAI